MGAVGGSSESSVSRSESLFQWPSSLRRFLFASLFGLAEGNPLFLERCSFQNAGVALQNHKNKQGIGKQMGKEVVAGPCGPQNLHLDLGECPRGKPLLLGCRHASQRFASAFREPRETKGKHSDRAKSRWRLSIKYVHLLKPPGKNRNMSSSEKFHLKPTGGSTKYS